MNWWMVAVWFFILLSKHAVLHSIKCNRTLSDAHNLRRSIEFRYEFWHSLIKQKTQERPWREKNMRKSHGKLVFNRKFIVDVDIICRSDKNKALAKTRGLYCTAHTHPLAYEHGFYLSILHAVQWTDNNEEALIARRDFKDSGFKLLNDQSCKIEHQSFTKCGCRSLDGRNWFVEMRNETRRKGSMNTR